MRSEKEEIIPSDPKTIEENSNKENDNIVTMDEMPKILELMHDRCVSRNLRAAGLGGYDSTEDKAMYGHLNPNSRLPTGEPILIATVRYVVDPEKQYKYVAILLNEGADPNLTDNTGKTALMYACIIGMDKSAKIMIQFGKTDLLQKDTDGNTILHYIVTFGRDKLLKTCFRSLRRYRKASSVDIGNVTMEDPLEVKNFAGECARSIAIMNNDYICLQLINDEKMRKLKALNKRIGLIQHARMTPSLSRTGNSVKKHMEHYSSFDSLFQPPPEDNSSEDELLGPGATSDFSQSIHRLKYATKYRSQPENLNRKATRNRSPDEEVYLDCDRAPLGPQELSIQLGVKLTNPRTAQKKQPISNRAAIFCGKSEMMRNFAAAELDSSNSSELNFSSILRQQDSPSSTYTPSSPTVPIKANVPLKSTVRDRIKNFLRRRPKYEVSKAESTQHISDYVQVQSNTQLRKGISQPDLSRGAGETHQPRNTQRGRRSPVPNMPLSLGDRMKERTDHEVFMRKSKETKREVSLPPIRNSHLLNQQKPEVPFKRPPSNPI